MTNLERPSDPELRRQMAQAEAEATRARFWLSCVRLALGGFVAVSSGALAGAGLWYFARTTAPVPNLGPDLGPPLVTAAGEDPAAVTLVPAPELATPRELQLSEAPLAAIAPDPIVSDPIVPDPSASDQIASDPIAAEPLGPDPIGPEARDAEAGKPPLVAEAEHPDPQALPVLVPDESLHLSWMEEPPIEMTDAIDAELDAESDGEPDSETDSEIGQASEDEAADAPAAGTAVSQPPAEELLRQPSAGQIDVALARLDLESLAPADVAPQSPPAWRQNAVPADKPFEGPVIAVVIDDLGLNRPNTRRTIDLPGPLTLALMTYAESLQDFADTARANGHELLVHFPMAPRDPRYDPGPNALRAELGKEELARRLAWGLSRFEGFVGLNNHMGSGFTTSIPGMAQVMVELKARGLLYLDSLTVPGAVGAPLADRLGVPFAVRDVFIDNDQDPAAIRRQLRQLERVAERRGAAIGIGHPHSATIQELATWLPEMQKRGFTLVPVSALVRTPKGLAVTPGGSNAPG